MGFPAMRSNWGSVTEGSSNSAAIFLSLQIMCFSTQPYTKGNRKRILGVQVITGFCDSLSLFETPTTWQWTAGAEPLCCVFAPASQLTQPLFTLLALLALLLCPQDCSSWIKQMLATLAFFPLWARMAANSWLQCWVHGCLSCPPFLLPYFFPCAHL